ncbi:MAG: DNA repair protein RecO [Mycoplasma sp.]|nr:DNA repair protein RecO [Mycoplasma sp.]
MAEKIYSGFVASRYNNGDDAIVKVITKNRVIDFIALGVNKPNSKNNVALQVSNFIEIEIFEARLQNKLSKLKKAHLLEDFIKSQQVFYLKNLLSIFKYINYENINVEKLFNIISISLKNLNEKNSFYILTWFLFGLLDVYGYKQINDRCVICNSKKNIIHLNLDEGGFICNLHTKKSTPVGILKNFSLLNNDINNYLNNVNFEYDKDLRKMITYFIKLNII